MDGTEIITSEDQRQREPQGDRSPHRRDGLRNNTQNNIFQSGTIQHTEETQKLFQENTKQSRGPSRFPEGQENERSGDRHTSPDLRHSVHDSTDQEDSPYSQRQNWEQSPHRGRKPGVWFHSPDKSSKNQRHSFHETPTRSTSGTQLSHISRKSNSKQNQSPSLHVSNHKRMRQSPQGGHSRYSHKSRKTHIEIQLKNLNPQFLGAENATYHLAIKSIILHIVAVVSSLMVIIPLALISGKWQSVRKACPLYVPNNIGYAVNWGNPSMLTCNIIAFIPIVIFVLSFLQILFHYRILHMWYTKNTSLEFALTRKYAVGTMFLTLIEAMVAWIIACMLTDGFRQTCFSFQLSPTPGDRPISCKYGFDNQDKLYMFQDLDTFQKLMIGLSGSWLCVIATTIMAVSTLVRTCSCRSN